MSRKGGRPPKDIDPAKLKALMRLKPTLKDTAAFFECDTSTIEKRVKKQFGVSYSEFREQNMVHTRFMLIRKAIEKAQGGDNVMLIFCLKNLCGWKDRPEDILNNVVMPMIIERPAGQQILLGHEGHSE